MKIKCMYCHQDNDQKNAYCGYCGHALPEPEQAALSPVESQAAGWVSRSEIKKTLESIVERHRHEEILTCREDCWCREVDALCMKLDQKNDGSEPR